MDFYENIVIMTPRAHTPIWARHSDHNRVFRYPLAGNHDLEPGSIYRVEYVDRVKMLWISLRLALWGGGYLNR